MSRWRTLGRHRPYTAAVICGIFGVATVVALDAAIGTFSPGGPPYFPAAGSLTMLIVMSHRQQRNAGDREYRDRFGLAAVVAVGVAVAVAGAIALTRAETTGRHVPGALTILLGLLDLVIGVRGLTRSARR